MDWLMYICITKIMRLNLKSQIRKPTVKTTGSQGVTQSHGDRWHALSPWSLLWAIYDLQEKRSRDLWGRFCTGWRMVEFIFTSSYCDFLSSSRKILLVLSKKFWNKMETTNLKREKTVKWKRRTRKWCLLWEKK